MKPLPKTKTRGLGITYSKREVLVTVRYADPKAFSLFRTRLNRGETPITHGATLLIAYSKPSSNVRRISSRACKV